MAKYSTYEEFDEEDRPATERIRRANADRQRKKEIRHRERQVVKEFETEARDLTKGRVLRAEGAHFVVETEAQEEVRARSIKSTASGNMNATLVAVGDEVKIELLEGDIAVIREVLPRRTKLSRRAHKRRDSFEQVIASNVDLVLIVQSAVEPPFRTGIIDRYILAALEGNLEVAIVLNKSDMLEEDERLDFIVEALKYYSSIGYPHFVTSALDGEGIEELREAIGDRTVVLAGKSGVGKSSLLNALLGEEIARTQGLMKKAQKGMHTTTTVSMIPLEGHHGYIVDTPGIKEFFHFEIDPDQLRFKFVEFLPLQEHCQMTGCLHLHEAGCAVSKAVDDDIIPEWRYNSYVAFWEEAERERKARIGGI